MLVYWGLLAVLTINTFLSFWIKEKAFQRLLIALSFIIVFAFAALREGIGVDYENYLNYYIEYETIGHFHKKMEIGYTFINYICNATGVGFSGLIIITSFLTFYPIFLVSFKTYKPLIQYIYFLLYYPMSYALIRQCIGISFAILSTYEFLSHHFLSSEFMFNLGSKTRQAIEWRVSILKCLIYALIACSFHNTLIIYFSVVIIGVIFLADTKKTTVLLACALALGLMGGPILNYISRIFANGQYHRYFASGSSSVIFTKRQTNSGLGVILRYFIYTVSFILITDLMKKRSRQEKSISNWMFIAMIGSDVVSLSSEIFLRIKFLFWIVYILPFFHVERTEKNAKVDLMIQLSCSTLLVLYEFLFRFRNELFAWKDIPYTSIFH